MILAMTIAAFLLWVLASVQRLLEVERLMLEELAIGPGTGRELVLRIKARTGKRIPYGSTYVTLFELEDQRCVRSTTGEPVPERGWRPRRTFSITSIGHAELLRRRRTP